MNAELNPDQGLTRKAGVALWRQIGSALEAAIQDRRYLPGEALPTELELARRFRVNRHTVRRALGALEEGGWVRAEQGRGTFVTESVLDYRIGKRTRFRENLSGQRRSTRGRLLDSARVRASATAARALGLRTGTSLIYLATLRLADGRPVSFGRHHFPGARFTGLVEAFECTESITSAVRQCGVVDFTRASTRIITRLPDEDELRVLKIARTRPVLVTESVDVDEQGMPIEYGVTTFAGDRVQLLVEP